MKRISLLMLIFVTTACSANKEAVSSVAAICNSQKVGSPFHIPDPMPQGVELWKPHGDQVSIGVRQSIFEELRGRKKQAICTLTIGSNELVTHIDKPAGA